jgi:hypothetical protein
LTVNSPVDLDERGRQLGRDIQELYSTLKRTKSLRIRPHINDVGDFIARYVPEGKSFDEAERILRAAGLTVHPRPGLDVPGKREDRFDVFATMALPASMISSAELLVDMRPKSPGDYSTVSKIWATISVTFL